VVTTTDKPALPLQPVEGKLERLCQEADALLATTAQLVADLEVLLEEGRQLKAAQKALMDQRQQLIKRPK
jgi:hypothetical protein